jgi:hypothetical protein
MIIAIRILFFTLRYTSGVMIYLRTVTTSSVGDCAVDAIAYD